MLWDIGLTKTYLLCLEGGSLNIRVYYPNQTQTVFYVVQTPKEQPDYFPRPGLRCKDMVPNIIG